MSHIHLVGWCVLIFFLQGILNAGVGWFKTNYGVGPGPTMFASAAALSLIFLGLIRTRRSLKASIRSRGTILRLFGLLVTTMVGFITWYYAISSALGPSRANFIDYATLPLFAFLVSLAVEDRNSLNRNFVPTIGICLFGAVLLVLNAGKDKSLALHETALAVDASSDLGLGVVYALTSALCGALSLHIVRRMGDDVEGAVLVPLRLMGVALCLLVISFILDDTKASAWSTIPQFHGGIFWFAIGLGVVLFLSLFVLFVLLQAATVQLISPYLFLIPFFTFLFEVVFRSREFTKIAPTDWFGMAFILVGLGWGELRGFVRSPSDDEFKRTSPVVTGTK